MITLPTDKDFVLLQLAWGPLEINSLVDNDLVEYRSHKEREYVVKDNLYCLMELVSENKVVLKPKFINSFMNGRFKVMVHLNCELPKFC